MDERPGLDRPPGERYGDDPAPGTAGARGAARAIAGAVLVAIAGAVAITILGGLLGVAVGLVVVAAVIAWLVAVILKSGGVGPRGTRVLLAVACAIGAVVLGQLGLWVITVLDGSVLGPMSYLANVFGLLVLLELAAAAGAAAWFAR